MADGVYGSFKPTELVLKVNGVQIPMNNIQACVVREWIFDIVPRIEVIFSDVYNITEMVGIKEYDPIELTMKYDKDSKANVKLKFVILTKDYSTTGTGVPVKIVQLTGVCAEKRFFADIKSASYPKSDTVSILKSMTESYGMKFDSNIKTNDTMNWLQCSSTDFEFTKHITNRSYKSDDDILFYYVDRKNVGNYKSVKESAKTKPEITFEYTKTLIPEKESKDKVKYTEYTYKDLKGISMLSDEFSDSIVQVLDDGKMEQSYFHDVSEKVAISNGSGVYRDNKNYARNSYYPMETGNTYQRYFVNQERRKFVERLYFTNMLIVSGLPHTGIDLLDTVNVNIPLAKTGTEEMSKRLSGKYIVGGIIHTIVGSSLYQCSYALFRNAENDI